MIPEKEKIYKGEKYFLDLHSTILSRKNSKHLLWGKLRYVKPKKPVLPVVIKIETADMKSFMNLIQRFGIDL